MSAPEPPRNLRLLKLGGDGRPVEVARLHPVYVGVDRDGLDLWEVTINAEEAEGASFVADFLPAFSAVVCRVTPGVSKKS